MNTINTHAELKLSSYKRQVWKYGTPISKRLYHELREYAERHCVELSGFKHFVGDIEVIKQVIDDVSIVLKDFPKLLERKSHIVLLLDYELNEDFANTKGKHIIHLNAGYYSNIELLNRTYDECVNAGRYVKNTNWHAIVFHELGHVVGNVYRLRPMDIAKKILKTNNRLRVLDQLTDILSVYSTELENGAEIISESFAGYYGMADNIFANEYVTECINNIREG